MNYNTLDKTTKSLWEPGEIDALSIYRALEQVEDARQKRGVRYSVALVLTLLLLGKAAGMTTLAAMSEWVRERSDWLGQVLPMSRTSFPCAATYSNVLRAVDGQQVNEVLRHLLLRVRAMQRCAEEPSRLLGQQQARMHEHVALDGKTLRGTLGHEAVDQKPLHQLGMYETHTGVLLKEQVTAEKQNELSIVSQFLTPVLVKGRIVSADALHTQRAFCASVTRWEGDYGLIAKANQPTLQEDVRLFFTEPPADCRDWRTARTCEKGHERREVRELIASRELNGFLALQWAGVAQVFQLTRTVYENGQCRKEVVYGLTSLSLKHASAQRLLELVRQHWAIENRLHWRRDVSASERMRVKRVQDDSQSACSTQQSTVEFDGSLRGSQCGSTDALLRCPP